jgi:hypothetical protein
MQHGSRDSAIKPNPYHILATKTKDGKGDETYWTGTLTVAGNPSVTVVLEKAMLFDNARAAYNAAKNLKDLRGFRAVRPRFYTFSDGFITRWWRKHAWQI